jgi:dual specificity tyrosine-phosphorylation-regulated kinase 2/3/4
LKSLNFLQKHKIIHCDIKPENILLKKNGKSDIKLIDFGSSCFSNEKLYSYIQSRYYRSPEIILGLGYDLQIDMWSFGCLLVELFKGSSIFIKGRPIFTGENEHDQLYHFMEYLGIPPDYIIRSSKRKKLFFDSSFVPLKYKDSKGRIKVPNSKKIHVFLESADQDLIDLIKVTSIN